MQITRITLLTILISIAAPLRARQQEPPKGVPPTFQAWRNAILQYAQPLDLSKGLEKLAFSATKRVEIDLDQTALNVASKILSDDIPEELAAKNVIVGLKGIYVRRYTFATDSPFTLADLKSIHDQLSMPSNTFGAGFRSVSLAWTRVMGTVTHNSAKMKSGSASLSPNDAAIEVWMCSGTSRTLTSLPIPAVGTSTPQMMMLPLGMVVMSATSREITIVDIVGPIFADGFMALGGRFGIPKINLPKKP